MINKKEWLFDNFTGFMIDKNVFLADKVNKQPISKGSYSNDILFNTMKNKQKYYYDKWISDARTLVSNDGKYKGIEIYLNNTDVKHNGRELKDIFAQNFNFLKTNYFHKSTGVHTLSGLVQGEKVNVLYSNYSLYSIDEENIFKYNPTKFFDTFSEEAQAATVTKAKASASNIKGKEKIFRQKKAL